MQKRTDTRWRDREIERKKYQGRNEEEEEMKKCR